MLNMQKQDHIRSDTSVIIKWLKEKYECEIIAFAADVGQGQELDPVREKALKTGASKEPRVKFIGIFSQNYDKFNI